MTAPSTRANRTGAKAAEIAERDARILRQRQHHFSLEQIAQQEGMSTSGVHKALKRALRATIQEPADELRIMELRRYDEILVGIWGQVLRGNLPAIDRAIRVMAQRAALLGLNAPTEINWTYLIRKAAEEEGLSPEERKEFERDVRDWLAETKGGYIVS